jgi:two-component system chemotaxis sensor kinase CheA
VDLEKRPNDAGLLASIFRTIHTIKGTCGFFQMTKLEAVTHVAENLLNQVRNLEPPLTPPLVSLILDTVDVVKRILAHIEATGEEGDESNDGLLARLNAAYEAPVTSAPLPACEVAPGRAAAVVVPMVAPGGLNDQEAKLSMPDSAAASVTTSGSTGAPSQDGEAAAASKGSVADSTIRVDVGLLDKLMNLVGELVLARNQILQFNVHAEEAGLNATFQRLNLITTQLQEGVMKTRMQPIGMVWNKLPRVVRDLAQNCGKQIQVEMDGAETELDKSIIEAIKDPLTHIVRNSCDHGIELPALRVSRGKPAQGRLLLRAFHEGGQVNIEVSDDGAGIDPQRLKEKAIEKGLLRPEQAGRMGEREAIDLVFHAGFTTAERVTNISGRGVGMDVVKTNIEKIGGAVDLVSRLGEGTTVKIKIPLTLAIIPGLVVNSGRERFVIPQVSLLELIRLEHDAARKQIERIHGIPVYRRRGTLLPIAYLNQVLRIRTDGRSDEAVNIVVLQAEDRQFGLVVDGIHDTQDIVVKPLGKQLKGLNAYAGATIMGDGKVALILDVRGLGQLSGVVSEAHDRAHAEEERRVTSEDGRQSYLVFRSGRFERLAVPLSLVTRIEEFPRATIERAGGQYVVQYRGRILALALLSEFIDPGSGSPDLQDPLQVVVFSSGEQRLGVIVDQVIDIVDDTVTIRQTKAGNGLAGSAVVAGKVTDFVDLHDILERAGQHWFNGPSTQRHGGIVMVAEGSPFSRGLMRNYLELAGHRVIAVSDGREALEHLEREPVDILVAALDLPAGGGSKLLAQLRAQNRWKALPALALATHPEDLQARAGFDECQMKCDRDAMLGAIDRLLAKADGNTRAAAPERAA